MAIRAQVRRRSASTYSRDTHVSGALGPVLFNGSNKICRLDRSASLTRIESVPDSGGAGGEVLRFTARNSDVALLIVTVTPRVQLITPSTIMHTNILF